MNQADPYWFRRCNIVLLVAVWREFSSVVPPVVTMAILISLALGPFALGVALDAITIPVPEPEAAKA